MGVPDLRCRTHRVLRKYDFTMRVRQGNNDVWLPTKTGDAGARAQAILDHPTGSTDPVMVPLRKL